MASIVYSTTLTDTHTMVPVDLQPEMFQEERKTKLETIKLMYLDDHCNLEASHLRVTGLAQNYNL